MVTYKVKAERLAEHEGLIAAVFAELAERRPAGLRYSVYKQADGLSFVHLAVVSVEGNPLQELPAFRAFTANVKDRTEAPPVTAQLSELQAYG
jgi:hypothetical protein